MVRTILTAEQNNLLLTLPDNFIGKQVEVIAFIVDEVLQQPKEQMSFTVLNVPDELKASYKFNRDDANER